MPDSDFFKTLDQIIDLRVRIATLPIHRMAPADLGRMTEELQVKADAEQAKLEPQLKALISRYARRAGI